MILIGIGDSHPLAGDAGILLIQVGLKEPETSAVQGYGVDPVADLHATKFAQIDLADVAGPHSPLVRGREAELLHAHHSVHDVVQGHNAVKLGDKDEIGVQIPGELADVLLEAGMAALQQVGGVVQDGIPAVDDYGGIVHILRLLEEHLEEVQDGVVIALILSHSLQALQEPGLGGIDHIPGREDILHPGICGIKPTGIDAGGDI